MTTKDNKPADDKTDNEKTEGQKPVADKSSEPKVPAQGTPPQAITESQIGATQAGAAAEDSAEELRDAGPMGDDEEGDEESPRAPDAQALLEMIQDADKVEIVFSDGERQIRGIPPLVVPEAKWNPITAGLQLVAGEVILIGPATGAADLNGYALFLDGEQVAWAPRHDTLRIFPGGHFNLSNDIVFPGL